MPIPIDNLTSQPTEASKNRDDLLKAIAFGTLTLLVSLSVYVYMGDRSNTAQQFADIREDLAIERAVSISLRADVTNLRLADVRLSSTDERRNSDIAYWRSQIEKFRKEQIINTQAIALFKTKPAGRYDPFTGSDGRELRGEIKTIREALSALEPRIDKLELCCSHNSDNEEEDNGR